MWILRRAASEKLRGRPCQEQTHVLAEQFSSKENIQVEGKSNIQTKVVTTLFAEVERDLISERTPRGPCPGSGPRAGSSAARKGSLGVFTARRQGGPKSSTSSNWVKRSPYSVFLHKLDRYPILVPAPFQTIP